MAANEHKNLTDINRHNPKGFEGAPNSTILSKGLGITGIADGNLEWVSKSNIKTDKVSVVGYCTLALNYFYQSNIHNNNKAPFDMNNDYGSDTISAATTVVQQKFFRIGVHMVNQDGVINNCKLQIASTSTDPFTVALCKYTPTDSATDVYPAVLYEKSVTGNGSNNVFTYNLSVADFTDTELSGGDHLILFAKADGAAAVGDTANIATTVEIGYSK
jgi:hypothetical protein